MWDPICRQAAAYLPPEIGQAVAALPWEMQAHLEELRFRRGCEITAVIDGKEGPLSLKRSLLCDGQMLDFLYNAASGYSAYAAQDTMSQGFLPLPGGHRLGFCGSAVMDQGQVQTFKALSSANFRVARQRLRCADEVILCLSDTSTGVLIVGPPGSGKTTLLRDTVRQLSDKLGYRVGLVDSRGEVAACFQGEPQLSVGRHTDVVSLIPRELGMELLLRVMSPQWIAVDEITAAADLEALMHASFCGVRLLATAHAFSREELWSRALYRHVMESGIFSEIIVLDREKRLHVERVELPC